MIISIYSILPFSAVEGYAHAYGVVIYLQSTQDYQVVRYFGALTLH